MKKWLIIILLLTLFGCTQTTQTLSVDESIQHFLEVYTTQFNNVVGTYESSIDNNDQLFLSGNEITYPEDYQEKYNSQRVSYIALDGVASVKEYLPVIQQIFAGLDFENEINGIEQNIAIEELGPGYTTVRIDLLYSGGIMLHYTHGDLIDEYFLLNMSEIQNVILENYSLSIDTESAQLGTYHYFEDNVIAKTISIYNADTYAISITDFSTNTYFHFSNLDGIYYNYYTDSDMIGFHFEQGNQSIQMYNEHGNFYSYTKDGSNIEIFWQLLEATGWDFVQSNSNSVIDNVIGIDVDDINIFDANSMRVTSIIYTDKDYAGLLLFQDFTEAELTDELLNLTRFNMSFTRNDFTIEGMNNLMSDKHVLARYYMMNMWHDWSEDATGFGQVLADSLYSRLTDILPYTSLMICYQ